jgi:hypothetical protein
MANGSNRYVNSRRAPSPTKFAPPVQRSEGRLFIDQDGTVYEVIWPNGRMPLSELGKEDNGED